jgi:peptidoglycan/xylan/chitin deacetylase (PgdA/CDA1 family)
MTFQYRLITIPLFAVWTLLFAPPSTMASSVQHRGFDRAFTSKKAVALTFDADMTPRMLSELTGLWIEAYTAATQELSNDPIFELGNHSYSHGGFRSPCYGLASIRKSSEAVEVQRTDDLLKKYANSYKKLFRFPGLCFDAEDIGKVEAQGYTVIGGDVYAGDGFEKSSIKIVSNVLAHVRPGSVVILHMHGRPNAPETAKALPDIIRTLRLRGYTFVKVSDLLSLSGSKKLSLHTRMQDRAEHGF